MDFDGNSKINCGPAKAYNIVTLSAWVKPDSPPNYAGIFGTRNLSGVVLPYHLGIVSNTFRFIVTDSTGLKEITANTSFSNNVWYHVMGVADGSTTKLYIDGVLQTTTGSYNGTISTPDDDLMIGAQTSIDTSYEWGGEISNVAIWNTDQSANKDKIYNNGSPQTSYTVTPQNWWKLNATSVYTPSAPNYTTALNFNTTPADIDFVEFGDLTTLATPATDFTFSMWLKVNNISSTNGRYGWVYSDKSGSIELRAGSGISVKYQVSIRGSSSLVTTQGSAEYTQWHHLAITLSGSSAKMYFNGVLVDTGTAGSATNFGEDVQMARYQADKTNNFYGFEGSMSNFAIFNSELSASQVSTLFNFGTPEANNALSPIHNWKLDNLTTGLNDTGSLASNNGTAGSVNGTGPVQESTSVVVTPSWKIPTALTIPTINYTSALKLESSNSESVAFSSSINTSSTSTFSMWLKPTSTNNQYLLSTGSGVNGILIKTSVGITKVYFYDFNATQGFPQSSDISSTLADGNWHHLAITRDNRSVNFYLDGNTINTGTPAFNADFTSFNISDFGKTYNTGQGTYYDGEVSNLAIFNSVLSQPNIQTLYNNGQPQDSISFTPTNWFKLNSINGTTVTDTNGSNDGTTSGSIETTDVKTPDLNIPVNGVSTTLPSTALQQSDLQFDSPYSSYSLSFDGAGDYIDTNYIFPTISTWSYSYWVNITDPGNSNYFYQVTARNSSTTGLIIWSGNGSASSQRNFTAKINSTAITFSVASFATWYNVVITGDGSNLTAYVDGTQVATTAISTLFPTLTYTTKIGSNKDGTNYFLNGKIDETSIFNYALSSAQVLEIYNNGKPGDLDNFSGTAPINWWRLGENAYFDNNSFTVPNSISGAPNGTGAGTVTSMLTADAPGTYANGVGTNLDIVDRVGDAALSVANSQSYNMIPDDKIPYVPEYVGAQTTNAFEMSFDGVDNSFDLGSEILFDSTKGFSFSAWIKLNSGAYSTSQYPGVFLLKTDQTSGFSMFLSQTASPSVGYQGINIGSEANFLQIKTDGNISGDFLNAWKHVCLTFDGVDRTATSSYKIYVDGSSVALTNSYLFTTHDNENHLGRGANINDTYFPGTIDEVAIFDKTLTADQVKFDLYNATTSGETADIENNTNLPTPLAWYRMGD
jgi:hypothetical protein